jgi:hypothetical protein
MSKPDKLYPSVHFNEEKTAITIVVVSRSSINEEEFLAAIYDWVKIHNDGFKFAEIGETVEFDPCIDDEYDGSPKH